MKEFFNGTGKGVSDLLENMKDTKEYYIKQIDEANKKIFAYDMNFKNCITDKELTQYKELIKVYSQFLPKLNHMIDLIEKQLSKIKMTIDFDSEQCLMKLNDKEFNTFSESHISFPFYHIEKII